LKAGRKARLFLVAKGQSLVVISAGQDYELTCCNFIHKAMFLIDAAGPASSKIKLQRFRLTYSGEGLFSNVVYQIQDFESLAAIFLNPVSQVFQSIGVKDQFHF
jgi:hypothetical protein